MSAYALHGHWESDSNLAENVMRPVVTGRMNFLTAVFHQAANITATVYFLMATCKKNGVDELEWLKDVFGRAQSFK